MTPGYIVVMPPLCAGLWAPRRGKEQQFASFGPAPRRSEFLAAVNQESQEAGSRYLLNGHQSFGPVQEHGDACHACAVWSGRSKRRAHGGVQGKTASPWDPLSWETHELGLLQQDRGQCRGMIAFGRALAAKRRCHELPRWMEPVLCGWWELAGCCYKAS